MKTEIPDIKLSEPVAPFIKAMDYVQAIIAERDEAIAKMERMRKWDERPHSRERTGLPCPRIEFEWVPSEQGWGTRWGTRWCMYWLVLELKEADIRAEDDEGKMGVFRERYIPMGKTKVTGGGNRPVWGGKVETPYRDGAHAQWDSLALGLPNLPVYARCEEDVSLVEQPKHS